MTTRSGARKPQAERRSLAVGGAVALKAFFRIAELWNLNVEEQMRLLGVGATSTFYHWRKAPPAILPRDTLERLSYIVGIYKALQILLPDPRSADGWIRKPNEALVFGGRSALQRMLSGNVADLFIVRQYLDAQRGGWA
ncbi:MAG: MbcA/ParS/Xre antitoxin family protein [Candidatus Eremiobacteraeota bacterium]|nr:MbcA/ParS/Xre antitoxin family protein [Candidatus Eremiobacteraeota bacterium]